MNSFSYAEIFNVAPYSWDAIAVAVFCGAVIGVERQLRGKPVGIRTASLITLGTYLYLTSAFLLEGSGVDQSRVIGQVITGIGFLGAGVMLAKDGAVVGVTSAATIWVLASIGVMIGVGHLESAVRLSLLVVLILYGVDALEDNLKLLSRGVHAKVKTRFKKGEHKAEGE